MSNTESTFDTATQKASDMAADARDFAADSVKEEAEKTRERAIEEMDDAAGASEAAQDEFAAGSLQAAALKQIGAQINAAADHLRDKPVDAMVDDVAVFARKNPLLFLGGAALAGFAAARFLKSGDGSARTATASHDPWAGHLHDAERDQ